MTLRDAMESYIAWRRSHGARFTTSARILSRFCRGFPGGTGCDGVHESDVRRFLAGTGPLTRTRANRYGALAGFYRFAISRGLATRSPLPPAHDEPREPESAPPHIYTKEELKRLFAAIDPTTMHAIQLDGDTLRMLLLLLYGARLRRSEAIGLTIGDVDLDEAVLTVRDTKFHKTRLVPVCLRLADLLRGYAARRSQRPMPDGRESAFLANRDGTTVNCHTLKSACCKLLGAAEIGRRDDVRRGPCLHSLRHTAAVHRVTAWYRDGKDVQRLLPALSTWLGHSNLAGTKVYLSMTPELLHEACARFDRYVHGDRT